MEKTEHPCQFPVELIERLVLSMTNENDTVFDPFLGSGTSIIAALKHKRKAIGAEIVDKYVNLARERVKDLQNGHLKTRPMYRPIYDPAGSSINYLPIQDHGQQLSLFDKAIGL